jgi:hypothetical protein
MRAMQEARRAILPPISMSASWANHDPKLRNSNKKNIKNVAGTSGGNLLQKSKTKWRQHFNQYY